MLNFLKSHAEMLYVAGSGLCALVMTLLRNGGFTTKDLMSRVTEGAMCSMLGSALSIIGISYFKMDVHLSIPIGTFVGFLGTGFIKTLIKGYVTNKAGVDHENERERD